MTNEITENESRIVFPRASRRELIKGAMYGGAATLLTNLAVQADAQGPEAHAVYPVGGRVREYWVQADSFLRNAVPNGYDGTMGVSYTRDQTTYWAVGFRAYTPNWGQPLAGNATIGDNLGIPGPVIRAEVGETIVIHFRNNDTHYGFPHSIHPHGVFYSPESDGAWQAYNPNKAGTAIKVGESYTYTYHALPSSVGTWVYHDHSVPQSLNGGAPVMEIGAELGLFGLFAITDSKTAPVDKEFILFFHDLYADDIPTLAQDLDCFNGYCFVGNTPTFRAQVGERIRWRIGALGKEFHVFHLHAHRWLNDAGKWTDTQHIGPSMSYTIEYVEDNPGDWLYHCHVTDHMMGGMMGMYISTQ